ncbi:MAG TPA: hypothetical protein VFC99_05675, partial [Acidimicrobiia bacterium]|nr:hypothetical protein [Acidimicrobiia bacterium]
MNLGALLEEVVGSAGVGWQPYTPQLAASTNAGTGDTNPSGLTVQAGRYALLGPQRTGTPIIVVFFLAFGAGANPGSGNYIVSMPFPLLRPPNIANDRFYGAGAVQQLFQVPQIPIAWVQSDPFSIASEAPFG